MGNLSLGTTTQPATAVEPEGAASAAAATATAVGQASKQLRQQEVIDDEDEEEGTGCAGGDATSSTAAANAGLPGLPGHAHRKQPGEREEEEEGDPPCTFVWDSSSRQPGAATAAPPAATSAGTACSAAAALKDQGNACLKAGDCEAAVRCYSRALAACSSQQQGGEQAQQGEGQQVHEQEAAVAGGVAGAGTGAADPVLLSTLHSNRAQALLKLKRHDEVSGCGPCWLSGLHSCRAQPGCLPATQIAATRCSLHCTRCWFPVQAAADALQAHRLHPTWPKPLYRYVGAASRRRGSLRALMHAAMLAHSCHASHPLPPPTHRPLCGRLASLGAG